MNHHFKIKTMIDLRECKPGDRLISSLGAELVYIGLTEENDYYDHKVRYLDKNMGGGSRTHDGYVFRHNRDHKTDHDIVKIIPKT